MLTPRFSNRRQHRKYRLRFTIRGTTDRPRLSVFRSAKHIYAQVIDDDSGRTLAQASTLEDSFAGFEGDKTAAAKQVGALVADRAVAAGVCVLGRAALSSAAAVGLRAGRQVPVADAGGRLAPPA